MILVFGRGDSDVIPGSNPVASGCDTCVFHFLILNGALDRNQNICGLPKTLEASRYCACHALIGSKVFGALPQRVV